ncbi:hypothetical protein NL676_037892 [Syzygium grande]|nr:hypothetical protein NL676_037892 [Syzygium grande]
MMVGREELLYHPVPSFARGLPILLVDHDPTSLASTRSLLGRYSFNVTGTELPSVALSIVREKKDWFKLVMANIDRINGDNFSILCELMKEEIPVILMSANRHKNTAGRSLAAGASYFLYKPISPENLKVLWQHAFRRRTILLTEERNARLVKSKGNKVLRKEHSPNKKIDKATSTRKAPMDQLRKKRGRTAEGDQVDERCAKKPKVGKSRFAALKVKGKGTTLGAGAKRSNDGKDDEREYKRPRIDSGRVDSDGENVSEEDWSTDYREDDSIGTSSPGRRRMRQAVWNPKLHRKFTAALSALGDDARPKTILQMMDVPYLTHRQVASHLQKYKNQVQRLSDIASANNVPSDGKPGGSNKRVEPHQQPDAQAPVSGQVGQASINFRSGGYADTSQQSFFPNPQLRFNNCNQIPNQVLQQVQNQYQQLSDRPANPTEQSSYSPHYEKLHNSSQASSHSLNYPGEESNFSNNNLDVNQGHNGYEGSIFQVLGTDLPNVHSINPVADLTTFTSQSMPPQVDSSLVLPGSEPVFSLQNQTMSLTAVSGNEAPTVPPQVGVEDNIFTGVAEIFHSPQKQHLWTALSDSSDLVDLQHHPELDSILNEVDTPFVPPELGREIYYYTQFASLVSLRGTSDNVVPSQENQYEVMNQGLTQSLAGDNLEPSQENQHCVMNQGMNLVAEVEPQPQAWFMNQSLPSDNPAPSQENQYHVMNQGLDLVPEAEPQPQAWFMNQSLISDNLMPSQENQHYVMNQELNLEVEHHPNTWFMNQTQTGDNPVTCQENQCHVMNQGMDLTAEAEPQPQEWFMDQSLTGDNLVSSPENQDYVMNQGLNLQVEPQPEAWLMNQSQTGDNLVTCQENLCHVMNQGLDLVAEAEPQPQAQFLNQSLTSNNLELSPENQHYVMNQGLNVEVEPQLEAWFMNETLSGDNPVTSQENQYCVMNQGTDLVAGVELQPQPQACYMNQPQPDYDVSLRTDGMEDLRVLLDEPMLDEINQFSEWLSNIFKGNDNPIIG